VVLYDPDPATRAIAPDKLLMFNWTEVVKPYRKHTRGVVQAT